METIELFQNEYFSLRREGKIVRMTRTKRPITAAAFAEMGDIFLRVFGHDLSQLRLLVDSREAPLSRDPEVERATAELLKGFDAQMFRRAVLVKTAIGMLQSTRLNYERGTPSRTFDDEQQAIAYLCE